jgi:hypothetical protein
LELDNSKITHDLLLVVLSFLALVQFSLEPTEDTSTALKVCLSPQVANASQLFAFQDVLCQQLLVYA